MANWVPIHVNLVQKILEGGSPFSEAKLAKGPLNFTRY